MAEQEQEVNSVYEHYRLYVKEMVKDKRAPAPAWPWTSSNRCSTNIEPAWHDVFKKLPGDLLGASWLAPSSLRESGFALWDAACAAGEPTIRTKGIRRPEEVAPFLSINGYYHSVMWPAVARSEPDPYVLAADKMCHGEEILNLAHVRAHQLGDCGYRKSGWWHSYAGTAYLFAKACAELVTAKVYDLPINPNAENMLPYGIAAYPSPKIGFKENQPYLQVLADEAKRHVDNICAYVCVSITPGYDPLMILDDADSRASEDDWWSYQPRFFRVVGWETPVGLMCRDLCEPHRIGWEKVYKKKAFTAPVVDLLPAQTLPEYIAEAAEKLPLQEGYSSIESWAQRLEHVRGYDRTPELPCRSCVMFHPSVQNGLKAPAKWRIYSNEVPRWLRGKVEETDNEKVLSEHKTKLTKAFKVIERRKAGGGVRAFRKRAAGKRRRWEEHLREERKREKRRRQ